MSSAAGLENNKIMRINCISDFSQEIDLHWDLFFQIVW